MRVRGLPVSKDIIKRFFVVLLGSVIAYATYIYLAFTYPLNIIIAIVLLLIFSFMGFAYPILKMFRRPSEPDLEFIHLVSHMLAASTGKAPNYKIVKSVAESDIYGRYRKYFKKIYALVKEYGYDFPDACVLVGKEAKEPYVKDFLERYATVVKVGEDVESFLETEFRSYKGMYEYIYGRLMDSLRILLGSYTAVMTSAIFITVNFLILSYFFGGDPLILAFTVSGTSLALYSIAYVIYLMMPKEYLVSKEGVDLPLYSVGKFVLVGALLASASLVSVYVLRLIDANPGLILVACGFLLTIPGYVFKKVEGLIKDIDRDYPTFIRMYSNNLAVIPSPLKALEPMLITGFGKIKKAVERLHRLLINNISVDLSLKYFARATGSELVRKSVYVLINALKLGSVMTKVGAVLSELSEMILRNRRMKYQVFKTFESSVLILHATSVILMSFIMTLLRLFNVMLAGIQTIIPFTYLPPEISEVLFYMSVIQLTAINSILLTVVNQGLKLTLSFYLGVLLMLDGFSIYAADFMTNVMFGSLIQGLSEIVPPGNITLTY